jgi:hypothetical protein
VKEGTYANVARNPPYIDTIVDAARLEACATSLYFSATSFFTRSSRALPWSPEAITSVFSFST